MTTTKELRELYSALNRADLPDRNISSVYCGDLLSHVMGSAPEGAAWVTVMSNVNVIAVASLTDVACVVIAEGGAPDDDAIAKADEHGVLIFKGSGRVFETALEIYERIHV
ncbi:MAG: hypothetical protein LBO70_01990 [Clostridiales Family XIII bacterium]|jgi:hypothetical protein|nr:hypothetical protein [Clostridiales Family XIII bacterium]